MFSSFAAAALVVATTQGSTNATIARQLTATDARSIAWGAFNAGEYHRDDLLPTLRQILEAPPTVSPSEEDAGGPPFHADTNVTVRWSTAAARAPRTGTA